MSYIYVLKIVFILISISLLQAQNPTSVPTDQPSVSPTTQPSASPTHRPSSQPTSSPTIRPTSQPSAHPSRRPTSQPSRQPTSKPTATPSRRPSTQPSSKPSRKPSSQPSISPTVQPSSEPSATPTRQPTGHPSSRPTRQPTATPSITPSVQPSNQPSSQPTRQPTAQPSSAPTSNPTTQPTSYPSLKPTSQPSSSPSNMPSCQPSSSPSTQPSTQPSRRPSQQPTSQPSSQPTSYPATFPTSQPTIQPTSQPTSQPVSSPTVVPTVQPSFQPTSQPIAAPSGLPSCQPSSRPSSQPSNQPTDIPSNQPSIQPTSAPTEQPTSLPTCQPTSQPSEIPSSQPTSFPSDSPTDAPNTAPSSWPSGQPSSQPSVDPSVEPTSNPTIQPTADPSSQPSLQPTSYPTSQPTDQPTSFPSSQPTITPSVQPSIQPTAHPTCQPSSQPTVDPTSQPSFQPSSQPTCQPTSYPTDAPHDKPTTTPSNQPSTQPSGQPSRNPTRQPTVQPSSHPTIRPTSQPSRQPSAKPTSPPSSSPSNQPSSAPSRIPSAQPSAVPTNQPTTQPTSAPSRQPSTQPTAAPSTQPSTIPTMQPTGQPTSSPTSSPTVSSPRFFYCADPCQFYMNGDCGFGDELVFIQCPTSSWSVPCIINVVGNFYTLNGTTLRTYIEGTDIYSQSQQTTCGLNIRVNGDVNIAANSAIMVPSLNLTSKGSVDFSGLISTAGLGSYDGPGSPTVNQTGWGASYGGSGGRPACSAPFSNINSQLGSIEVQYDFYGALSKQSYGSGGGFPLAGLGGGRIILQARGYININLTGTILAEGSASEIYSLGSGSGGSVSLIGNVILGSGLISVNGGDTNSIYAGAGGGGRIMIQSITTISSLIAFQAFGGYYTGSVAHAQVSCLSGSAGTVYFMSLQAVPFPIDDSADTSSFESASNLNKYFGSLSITGSRPTNALTYLKSIPSATIGISVSGEASIGLLDSIQLQSLESCSYAVGAVCSTFTTSSAVFRVITSLYSCDVSPCTFTIAAQNVSLLANSIIILPSKSNNSIAMATNMSVSYLLVDETSSIEFDSIVEISAEYQVTVYGVVRTSNNSFPTDYETNLAIRSKRNITVFGLIATNVLLSGHIVRILPTGYIQPTPNFAVTGCWRNISTADFSCNNANAYNGTIFSNNTIVVAAKRFIGVSPGAVIEGSAILLCSTKISVYENSLITAAGRGCQQNVGAGSGEYLEGIGSGGGFGGYGGSTQNTDVVVTGGQPYYSGGKLFSGSSGGCSYHQSTKSSMGGGIVSLHANYSVFMNGTLLVSGADGNGTCGGGSGGMVTVRTFNMVGGGKIIGNGGAGSSLGNVGGGGGGGGVALIYNYNPNDYNTFKNFLGTISVLGGVAIASSAQSGGEGSLPKCPLGYGTSYGPEGPGSTLGPLCIECDTGMYKDRVNSNPCIPCANGLGAFKYVSCGTEPSFGNSGSQCPATPDCPYICVGNAAYEHCLNPIVTFLFLAGEWACTESQKHSNNLGCAWGGCFFDFCMVILLFMSPIYYYRWKQRQDYNKQFELKILSFNANLKTKNKSDDVAIEMKDATVNPLRFAQTVDTVNEKSHSGGGKSFLDLKKNAQDSKELRLAMRLADNDMSMHACRVYLIGTNSPPGIFGGQWTLSQERPTVLRPMLFKKSYASFACLINQRMEWNSFGWEMILYRVMSLLLPPFATSFLTMLRQKRTDLLISLIAEYDHACFKSVAQRMTRCSLRVGVSPDNTLAYIDFLFDELTADAFAAPLIPVGQPRLPASFRFAGIGSYFTPWHLDTNDVLLQAISSTDVASSFIDEAWITFIVELNTIIRTIRTDALHSGLLKLIRFLGRTSVSERLGGVILELCTFPNRLENSDTSDSQVSNATTELEPRLPGGGGEQATESSSVPVVARPESMDLSKARPKSVDINDLNHAWEQTAAASDNFESDEFYDPSERHLSVQKTNFKSRLSLFSDGNNHRGSIVEESIVNDIKRMFAPDLAFNHEMRDAKNSVFTSSDLSALDISEEFRYRETNEDSADRLAILNRSPTNAKDSKSQNTASMPAAKPTPVQQQNISVVADGGQTEVSAAPTLTNPVGRITCIAESAAKCVSNCRNILFPIVKLDDNFGFYSFDEMCRAISLGQLSLGVLVTHPKVLSFVNRVDEDDYLSDDEYLLALGSKSRGDGRRYEYSTRQRQKDGSDDDVDDSLVDGQDIGHAISNRENKLSSKSAGSGFSKTGDGKAVDSVSAIYGEKRQEISKFYDIVRSAELQTKAMYNQQGEIDPVASKTTENLKSNQGLSEPDNFDHFSHSDDEDESKLSEAIPSSSETAPTSESGKYSEFKSPQRGFEIAKKTPREAKSSTRETDKFTTSSKTTALEDFTGDGGFETLGKGSGDKSARSAAFRPMVSPFSARRSMTSRMSFLSQNPRSSEMARPTLIELSDVGEVTKKVDPSPIQEEISRSSDINIADSYPMRSISTTVEEMNSENFGFGIVPDSMSYSKFVPEHIQRKKAEFQKKYEKLDLAPSNFQIRVNSWKTVGVNGIVSELQLQRMRANVNDAQVTAEASPDPRSVDHLGMTSFSLRKSDFGESWQRDTIGSSLNTAVIDANQPVELSDSPTANPEATPPSTKATAKQSPEEQKTQAATAAFSLSEELKQGMLYLYFNQFFFWSYLKQLCLGRNVYPHGPPLLRHLLGILILFLSCVDLALFVFMCVEFYCLWSITCHSQLALILPNIIFPGALLLSPLSGMVAILLGPSSNLARIHACWSRLALISNLVVVCIFVTKAKNNSTVAFIVGLLVGSRVFQCCVIDLYISHVEQIRWTRGWDGLVTSLYADNDKKVDIRGD